MCVSLFRVLKSEANCGYIKLYGPSSVNASLDTRTGSQPNLSKDSKLFTYQPVTKLAAAN